MKRTCFRTAVSRTVAALVTMAGALAPASTPAAAATPVAQFNREVYSYSSSLSLQAEAQRYSVLILQSTDGNKVAALHGYNPNLKIFMYMHVVYARSDDPQALTVCTSLPDDLKNHQDWFMRGSGGQPVTFGTEYIMDVGNPAYQQACIAHAVALAKHWGFDGVMIEGIGARLAYDFPGATSPYIPEYPTDSAWQAAAYTLLTYAGSTFHSSKLLVIDNLGGSVATPGLWQKWSGPLDGSIEESWTDGGAGTAQQIQWWAEKLAQAAWSEANHKIVVLHSYNTTEAGNTYGLASMLLIADGESSYSTSAIYYPRGGDYTDMELWYPEYSLAQQLGAPLGAYTRRSNGVYERAFANGIVLVNASYAAVPAFSLGGVYSGSGLTGVSSVAMAPASALILARVAPTPPPPIIADSALTVHPSSFRAALSGRSILGRRDRSACGHAARRAARRHPLCATVSYRDSRAGTTVFTIYRLAAGVRRGRRCVAPGHGRRHRSGRHCARVILLKGRFTHRDRAGLNRFRFTGRLGGQRLGPGVYELVATPVWKGRFKGPRAVALFVILR